MYKNRKHRTLIISGLFAILICMVVGYAAFSTSLEIKGTSSIDSRWEVK